MRTSRSLCAEHELMPFEFQNHHFRPVVQEYFIQPPARFCSPGRAEMKTAARTFSTKSMSNTQVKYQLYLNQICRINFTHVACTFYLDVKPVASAWKTVGYTVDRRYLITGLTTGNAYRVRVSARNAVGWSGYSIASSEFRLHSGNLVILNYVLNAIKY